MSSSSRMEKSVFPPPHVCISSVCWNSSSNGVADEEREYADGSICLSWIRSPGSGAFLSSVGNDAWKSPHSGHLNVPRVSIVPQDGHRTERKKICNRSVKLNPLEQTFHLGKLLFRHQILLPRLLPFLHHHQILRLSRNILLHQCQRQRMIQCQVLHFLN